MLKWIIVAIVVVPLIEIWGIVQLGSYLGFFPTIGLMIFTAVLGGYLAKKEGRNALLEIQQQIRNGHPPGHAVLDGICILIGGILLLTPGFFTDLVGLTILFPVTRPFYRHLLYRSIAKKIF